LYTTRSDGLMAAICVFCASAEHIDARYIRLAEHVGARIAKGGHTLVSGGSRVSMMGAVARAARAGGAHTVGVMPQALIDIEVGDVDAGELIIVDTMRERKRLMDQRSDAFLALPGGIGTLEECFEVWTAGSIGMHDKPVLVLDPDGFYRPLWTYIESLVDRGFVRQAALERLHRVSTVDDAFAVLDQAAPRH
jgi:uncharacterized protein (TIGR00730 family)